MKFEEQFFVKFNFTREQVQLNLKNAFRDLTIAQQDKISEVKFSYAYTAIIKAGIAVLSHRQIKAKSVPGHHIKIIEKLAEFLGDESIADMANVMRSKRNLDLYAGGIEITDKECRDYLSFAENVLLKVKSLLHSDGQVAEARFNNPKSKIISGKELRKGLGI